MFSADFPILFNSGVYSVLYKRRKNNVTDFKVVYFLMQSSKVEANEIYLFNFMRDPKN